MKIKVVSKLLVDNRTFEIGEVVKLKTKCHAIVTGELVSIFHNKIVIKPKKGLNYWVEFKDIEDVEV